MGRDRDDLGRMGGAERVGRRRETVAAGPAALGLGEHDRGTTAGVFVDTRRDAPGTP